MIEPYPADSIIVVLEIFDAVSKGEIECGYI